MRRLVLDASAAVALVTGRHPDQERTLAALAEADTVLAPRLYWSEVANAFWKYARRARLPEAKAIAYFEDAVGLVQHPIDDESLAAEALLTAIRFRHPVYDAIYAVLARRHGADVVTLDRRMRSLLAELRVTAL